MTLKSPLLLVVVVLFCVPTYVTLSEFGYVVFFRMLFTNSASLQAFVDLSIAITLIIVWMVLDTRRQERAMLTVVPFVAISICLGSFGPLFYLIYRDVKGMKHEESGAHRQRN